MKLSVVVPVFNKAPFIRECFESVLSQSFGDYELIVVDDRSTDDSVDAVNAFRDDRMQVVRLEKNLGPAGAAQRAMDLATGEYILRVDADDISLPDRFAKQVAFMDRYPELGASGGHLQLFGSETGLWRFPVGQNTCHAEVLFGNPVAQGTVIMRTRVLRDNGLRFHDDWPRIGEDWMLWARLSLHARFDNLDEPLILYRRGEQNSSFGLEQTTYRRVILRDVFSTLGVPLSDAQCDLHLMGLRSFAQQPTRASIHALRDWFGELRAMNRTRHLFEEAAFDARIRQVWEQLFFALPRFGVAPALEHFRLSDRRDSARLGYLAKYTVNRWLGRLP